LGSPSSAGSRRRKHTCRSRLSLSYSCWRSLFPLRGCAPLLRSASSIRRATRSYRSSNVTSRSAVPVRISKALSRAGTKVRFHHTALSLATSGRSFGLFWTRRVRRVWTTLVARGTGHAPARKTRASACRSIQWAATNPDLFVIRSLILTWALSDNMAAKGLTLVAARTSWATSSGRRSASGH
jgi:hypothetical protein